MNKTKNIMFLMLMLLVLCQVTFAYETTVSEEKAKLMTSGLLMIGIGIMIGIGFLFFPMIFGSLPMAAIAISITVWGIRNIIEWGSLIIIHK